jgi:5-methylcytosine-specific restriction protein A
MRTPLGHFMTDTRPWRHLYGRARWRALRLRQLAEHPLCAFCLIGEVIEPATVVDHIKPHKGDVDLFHDPCNLQSLCAPCHDRDKKLEEHGKVVIRFGPDGFPLEA